MVNNRNASPPSPVLEDWELFAKKHYKRNYIFGVMSTAIAMSSITQVIPLFFKKLLDIISATDPFYAEYANSLVGSLDSLTRVLQYLPLLFLANYIEIKERKKVTFFYWMLPAAGILIVLAYMAYFAALSAPKLTFYTYYVLFPLFFLFFGALSLMIGDMVGKIIPLKRRNGFYGVRFAYGSIFGMLVVGQLTSYYFVYQNHANPFRDAYAPVIFFGFIFIAISWIAFLLIKEPIHSVRKERKPLWLFLKNAVDQVLLKDKNFRAFYIMRSLQYLGYYFGYSFFALYMAEELGLPQDLFGKAITFQAIVSVLGFFIFGRLGNIWGSKFVIQVSNIAGFIGTLGFVFIPNIADWITGMSPGVERFTAVKNLYLLFYIFIQICYQTQTIGRYSYVLDIAPKELRPTYIGFAQTGLLPFLILCMFNGVVADILSRRILFGICAVFFIFAMFATRWMENVKKQKSLNSG